MRWLEVTGWLMPGGMTMLCEELLLREAVSSFACKRDDTAGKGTSCQKSFLSTSSLNIEFLEKYKGPFHPGSHNTTTCLILGKKKTL